MKKLDAEICRATECEYDHYLCGHNSGCSIYRCVESLIEKRLAEKPDTMELVVKECRKHEFCADCKLTSKYCPKYYNRPEIWPIAEIKARMK